MFLSWGLAAHVPLLAVFAITYGFFVGGLSSTYIGMCREAVKKNPGAELGMVRTFRTNAVDFANAVETEGVWGACRREGCGQCDYWTVERGFAVAVGREREGRVWDYLEGWW